MENCKNGINFPKKYVKKKVPKDSKAIRNGGLTLSPSVTRHFFDVLPQFKNSTDFQTIASYHGLYADTSQHRDCFPEHNNHIFLAWHTAYLIRFENALAKHLSNPNLGLPYIDWKQPCVKCEKNREFVQHWSSSPIDSMKRKTVRDQTKDIFKVDAEDIKKKVSNLLCQDEFDIFYNQLRKAAKKYKKRFMSNFKNFNIIENFK